MSNNNMLSTFVPGTIQQQDIANLEAWKSSQQRTIELIINLFPQKDQEHQRQQIDLIRQFQAMPLTKQSDLLSSRQENILPSSDSVSVRSTSVNPPPLPVRTPVLASCSNQLSDLQAQFNTLQQLRQVLDQRLSPQQQILDLTNNVQNLQNQHHINHPQPSSHNPNRIHFHKENVEYALEHLKLFKDGHPHLLTNHPNYYRIKPIHDPNRYYYICKTCESVFSSRHIAHHIRTHVSTSNS